MSDTLHQRFAQALTKVKAITKDQTADAGKYSYSYADVNSILKMLKEVLHDVGLVLSQPLAQHGDTIEVTTMLLDPETGDSIVFGGPIMPITKDPQAVGSAITYYRRYSLVSLFALEASDDDGQYAHRAETAKGRRTPAEQEAWEMIRSMTRDEQAQFKAAFKEAFGCGLSDLPESKHGDALTFTKSFTPAPPTPQGEVADNG